MALILSQVTVHVWDKQRNIRHENRWPGSWQESCLCWCYCEWSPFILVIFNDERGEFIDGLVPTFAGATPSGLHSFLSSTMRRLFRTSGLEKNSVRSCCFWYGWKGWSRANACKIWLKSGLFIRIIILSLSKFNSLSKISPKQGKRSRSMDPGELELMLSPSHEKQ